MNKVKEFFSSPHIQIALASGFSIIILAVFSKKILPEPLSYLSLAFPPFIATMFESLYGKYKTSPFLKTVYWILAILLSTVIIIILHL